MVVLGGGGELFSACLSFHLSVNILKFFFGNLGSFCPILFIFAPYLHHRISIAQVKPLFNFKKDMFVL